MIRKVLIVLPAHNEEDILFSNLTFLHNYCEENLKKYEWQIVIAENGSTDNTFNIAQELSKIYPKIKAFHLEQGGKGGAIKKAWEDFNADFYVFMDTDLATDLTHLQDLLFALEEEKFDIAIGSRLKKDAQVKRSWQRKIISCILSLFLKLTFYGYKIKDSPCGFKAISKNVQIKILPLVKNLGWVFDTELLIKAHYAGFKIKEIPVRWEEKRTHKTHFTKLIKIALEYIKEIRRIKQEIKK